MLSPYYTSPDGRIILYNGDCRSILPQIGRVDCVVTDPPYASNIYKQMRKPDSAGGGMRHTIKAGQCLALMRGGEIGDVDDLIEPMSLAFAAAVSRWCIVFSDVETCHKWRESMSSAGLKYVRTGAWVKPNAMPQMTGDRPAVGFEPCTIMHAATKMKWNGGGHHAVWTHNICREDRPDHPCPKPLPLMIRLINLFSDIDALILDPFTGSGTTAVACIETKRRFVGVEISENYCRLAVERIETALEKAKQMELSL